MGREHVPCAWLMELWEGNVEAVFGYRLAELGHFHNFDDIHLANRLWMPSAAVVGGYCHQESVIASN